MRPFKEDSACNSSDHVNIDIISVVEELSEHTCKRLNNLLKDSENFTIQCNTGKGSLRQINVERLASSLPLHLIAVLLSRDMEMDLVYLLRGVRLLHTLSDLASHHCRLEQILFDDVKFSEQLLDLVFFMLIVLARYVQGNLLGTSLPFLHSALVACTLHLLPAYISSQRHDLVHVLLAHPKVDIFMDTVFHTVHVDIRFLHYKLSALNNDALCNTSSRSAAERTVHYLCQQCEASLQFLLSLYQQKLFQNHFVENKELCKNGGILSLAWTILKLNIPDCFKKSVHIVASVSRIKSKVLSILMQLCEAESGSYLDEVAGSPKRMRLAESVALEILNLLKATFRREAEQQSDTSSGRIPKGLVLLNSLSLADIFSDDSNFRSFFMTYMIDVLVEILGIPHEEFLSSWCSIDIPMIEEDANIEYDSFTESGVALFSFTGGCEIALSALLYRTNFSHTSFLNGIPSVTYAKQRTSCLVKIVANLHCFIPNLCEEKDRNLFLNKFHQCLHMENPESFSRCPSNSDALRAATICKNLSSLSHHATSLIPSLLNDEDVRILRLFFDQLQKLIPQQIGNNLVQDPFLKDVEDPPVNKLEDQHPMQQSLQPRIRFANLDLNKPHQEDAQNTGGGEPSMSKKSDSSVQEEDPQDKDVNLKQGNPESSLGQADDKSKAIDLTDDIKLSQNITNASGSLRGTEKEIYNLETEGAEWNMEEVFRMPDYPKEGGFQQEWKTESVQGEEKQQRKRKRNIMNEKQILLIEKALLEEPEMQRNAASLQSWADKLSAQGSEITSSQLRNWLNNRKAKLARAARESQPPSEGDHNAYQDRSCGPNTSQQAL